MLGNISYSFDKILEISLLNQYQRIDNNLNY